MRHTLQEGFVSSRHFARRQERTSTHCKGKRRFRWYTFLTITVNVLVIIYMHAYGIFLLKGYLEQQNRSMLLMPMSNDETITTTRSTTGGSGASSDKNERDGAINNTNYNSTTNPFFPPACSAGQLETIRHQLPPERCIEQAKTPFMRGGQCSFSFATRCPDSVWLHDYFRQQKQQTLDGHDQQLQQPSPTFMSVYVGCNKGMDAINTLRMGSGNATYDKDIWRDTLFAGRPSSEIESGHCGQEFGSQFEIHHPSGNDLPVVSNAIVHCIEPLPRNFNRLAATAKTLQIHDHFQVHAVAISNRDGVAYFPRNTKIGDEQKGIGDCDSKNSKNNNNKNCQAIPMYKLDTFMSRVLKREDKSSMIDFLSIDVEGYDSLVLQGGKQTLLRTKYMEFEYNWKGPWAHVSLLKTIESLKSMNFACYWAGSHRNIWRITDCWLDHYDTKFWSNVACVNMHLDKELANLMEQMFHETLQQGHAIQYKDFASTNTDGRVSAVG